MDEAKNHIYYLSGLDCADCARKFARDVEKIAGVESAEVIFAANKLIIHGEADHTELEKLAKVEGISIIKDSNEYTLANTPAEMKYYLPVILGAFTLILGLIIPGYYGKALLILTIAIGGGHTIIKALRNIRNLKFDMSVLMTIAVTGALTIGEWHEAALVSWLFALSDWLESYTANKARNALKTLIEQVPKQAIVIRNGENITLPVSEVRIGERILVQAGEKIPLDGLVQDGSSQVNQASVTGESMPVEKNPGDQVFGGTINEMGALIIEVSHLSSESTMEKIIHLVEEAQNKQSNSQTFIENFAAKYTPVVIILAAFVAIIPPLFFTGEWHKWIYEGLSLLVVACPCALVITTPVVLVAAMSNGAANGVIIKGGRQLEALSRIRQIAFDKTGTLSYGIHEVKAVESLVPDCNQDDILILAASVEVNSSHPLAKSIYNEANKRMLAIPQASGFTMYNAKGAAANVENKKVWVGKSRTVLNESQNLILAKWQKSGHTVIFVEIDGKSAGLIVLSDTIRNEAREAIKELKNNGIEKIVMLTGDNDDVAKNAAENISIDQWQSELLPQDKLDYINRLKNDAPTMMVGDGINDAPALALADIGLAMGAAGSDTALEVADVALMTDDLTKIPYAISLGKRALRTIRQNITIAIGLKFLVILTIFPGWLSLWLAIVADMGANIIVTLNGIRLVKNNK